MPASAKKRDEAPLLLDISEIPVARMLEISSTAVDQRYSRALKKLRGNLQDSVFAELDDG